MEEAVGRERDGEGCAEGVKWGLVIAEGGGEGWEWRGGQGYIELWKGKSIC